MITNNANVSYNGLKLPVEAQRQIEFLGFTEADKVWLLVLPAKQFVDDLEGAKRFNPALTYTDKQGKTQLIRQTYYLQQGKLYQMYGDKAVDKPLSTLATFNSYGCGVYIRPNKGGNLDREITEANTLFYECDDLSFEDQWIKLQSFEAELDIKAFAVQSGKSLHPYFKLNQPTNDLAAWRKLQQRLILKLNSDKSIHNPSRLMRLAGFNHQKWDKENQRLITKPVAIVQQTTDTVTLQAFDQLLPHPVIEVKAPKPSGRLDGFNLSMLNLAEYLEGYDPDGRNGWTTAKCPAHNGESFDSLHVNHESGRFHCQSHCSGSDIWKAALQKAIAFDPSLKDQIYKPQDAKPYTTEQKQEWAEKAKELADKYRGLGHYKPDVLMDSERFILPELKQGLNIISSACKTGKTTALAKLEKEWEASGKQVHHTAYRNGLLFSTIKQSGSVHIHDYNKNTAAIAASRSKSFAPDSAHLIPLASIEPNALYVIDECDHWLKHILGGGTLGDRQAEKLVKLKAQLRRIVELGGTVVCMEDSITQLTIDSYRKLLGLDVPVQLIVNERFVSKWNVVKGAGSRSAFTAHLLNYLGTGKRAIAVADAQSWLEQVEVMIGFDPKLTYKILRVDSTTLELPHVKEFLSDPQAYLAANHVDLLLISPTAESGLSITTPGFDRVYGYFTHCSERQANQLLERYRLDVDRYVYCSKFAQGANSIKRLNPEAQLKALEAKMDDTVRRVNVERVILDDANNQNVEPGFYEPYHNLKGYKQNEDYRLFNGMAIDYQAREDASKAAMLHHLTQELMRRGHTVTETKWGFDKTIEDELRTAKATIEENEAIGVNDADATKHTYEQALHKLSNKNLTRSERFECLKTKYTHEYPGVDLNDLETTKFLLAKRGKNRLHAQRRLDLMYRELAHDADRKKASYQFNQPFIMVTKTPDRAQKADLMDRYRYAFDWLLNNQFSENSPVVKQFYAVLFADRHEILETLKINIRELQPAIKGVQAAVTRYSEIKKILTYPGYKTKEVKRAGSDGARVRIYEVSNKDCPLAQALLTALLKKHEDRIAEIEAARETSTFYKNNCSSMQNVDVTSQIMKWLAANPSKTYQDLSNATGIEVDLIKQVLFQHR